MTSKASKSTESVGMLNFQGDKGQTSVDLDEKNPGFLFGVDPGLFAGNDQGQEEEEIRPVGHLLISLGF